MSNGRTIIVLAVAGSLVCTGYLFGQQLSKDGADKKVVTADFNLELAMTQMRIKDLKGEDNKAETAKANACADAVVDVLESATRNPQIARSVAQRALWLFELDKGKAESAVQVSQAADEAAFRLRLLQVQQNQRIIELLERLTSRDDKTAR